MDTAAAWPPIALTILLLAINAFFVAAEFALVRVRRTQVEEMVAAGSARAKMVSAQLQRIDSHLSACQVGITGASLALGWIGEPAVATLISPLFGWVAAFSEALFHGLSFAIAFALITYLHIVIGEQAPKYFAIQRAVPLALLNAYPLGFFYRVFYPFTWLVNASANRVLFLFGIRPGTDHDVHSGEELKLLVEMSADSGELQETEREIVGNALGFAETLVRQAMVPRTEIVAVEDTAARAEVLAIAKRHPFSRFPVYHQDLDNIVGVVHLRDLAVRDDGQTARELMRPVPLIPETAHLDQVLAVLRRRRASLAIVLDEFGGTAGLVTLQNVLEDIVGEVLDEFEKETQDIREEAPGRYLIDGLVSLDEVRERIGLTLADEEYDTAGGLVFGHLGRVPSVGDRVVVDGWRFDVVAIDGHRVAQVRAERCPSVAAAAEPGAA
ncbi:MAG: hemolysin family protein [Candidatus Limnocylindria bacterium]|nr:hemolysin family protein [Candidatus Limnocylindria bacterium]